MTMKHIPWIFHRTTTTNTITIAFFRCVVRANIVPKLGDSYSKGKYVSACLIDY